MTALERLLIQVLTAIVLASAVGLGVRAYGAHWYDAGYTAGVDAGAQAAAKAVIKRTQDNAALAARQDETNANITKEKDDEIADLRRRLAAAPRLRVGSAVCGDGPAAPAQTQGAAGSDSADPPGRLVRPDVERDLIALKLAVEEDLATGRACQAVLKDEGMVP